MNKEVHEYIRGCTCQREENPIVLNCITIYIMWPIASKWEKEMVEYTTTNVMPKKMSKNVNAISQLNMISVFKCWIRLAMRPIISTMSSITATIIGYVGHGIKTTCNICKADKMIKHTASRRINVRLNWMQTNAFDILTVCSVVCSLQLTCHLQLNWAYEQDELYIHVSFL